MSRQTNNLEILEILKKVVEANPDLRFGQILVNTEVIQLTNMHVALDPHSEESQITLNRIKR